MSEPSQKLTLEQRLELATKSRKKGRSKNKSHARGEASRESTPIVDASAAEDPTKEVPASAMENDDPSITPSMQAPETTFANGTKEQELTEENQIGVNEDVSTKTEPELVESQELLAPPESKKVLTKSAPSIASQSSPSIALNPEVLKNLSLKNEDLKLPLKDFLARLETQTLNYVRSVNSNILKKDETINQLRKEGNALSKKELKLSDTVKALKKDKTKLEMKLEICQEELSSKISESEKIHSEFYTIKEKHDALQESLSSVSKEKELLSKKLADATDIEISGLKNELDKLKSENEELKKSHNSLIAEYDQYKSKSLVQNETLKTSSDEEIAILETKLEQLRIKLEDQTARENSSHQDAEKSEYLDKLQAKYNQLTKELQKTNENWSNIEQNLHNRLLDLKNDYEKSTSIQKELTVRIDTLDREKEHVVHELSKERDTASAVEKKNAELQSQVDLLAHQLESAKRDAKMLNDKIKLQNKQLEEMFATSSRSVDQKKEKTPRASLANLYKLSVHKEEDETEDESEVYDARDALKLQLEDEWDIKPAVKDKGVDLQSEAGSMHDPHSANASKLELDVPTPTGFQSVRSFSRNSSYVSQQFLEDNDDPVLGRRVSNVVSTPTQQYSSNPTSTQLMARMGGQVRRLETELASLRDSWDKLQREKSQAQEEILRLMMENERLISIQKQNTTLSQSLKTLKEEQQQSKQQLDSKERKIQELENDVADLKELMHSQIQQMVELQERCR
ncbi:hypothetical protein ACO0QE_000370 [Hanseniaspora vineae]